MIVFWPYEKLVQDIENSTGDIGPEYDVLEDQYGEQPNLEQHSMGNFQTFSHWKL